MLRFEPGASQFTLHCSISFSCMSTWLQTVVEICVWIVFMH